MKQDIYKIDNSVERLFKNKHTLFLDQKELKYIKSKLKKNDYNIYYPYKDAERVILYKNTIPSIKLYKITSYNELRHQDILGSLMNLNISPSYIGDIVIDDNNYYFYSLASIDSIILEDFNLIKDKHFVY